MIYISIGTIEEYVAMNRYRWQIIFGFALIIHRMLRVREQRAMLRKLNMVIGSFFSEVGLTLMGIFVAYDPDSDALAGELRVTQEWSRGAFLAVGNRVKAHNFIVNPERLELERLREFLKKKRGFLLNLIENPNLLEHESFTDLMWAVFHLAEELSYRGDVKTTSPTDFDHLSGDIRRTYSRIVLEWLHYMEHLKEDYPYLFSLAMRTNPFDPEAKVEVG
jgi:hypothetical protein